MAAFCMVQKMTRKTDFLSAMPTLIQTKVMISAKISAGTAPKTSAFISEVVYHTIHTGYCGKWEEFLHCTKNALQSDCHRN
jgi:hypothetical protein